MSVRRDFLESALMARALLAHPEVASHWDDPSALSEMTVGALAGHLLRSVTTVSGYLTDPPIAGFEDLLDAPGYWLSIDGLSGVDGPDLESDLHRGIRSRAEVDAGAGPQAVLEQWDRSTQDLASRLATEPPTRVVQVIGGRTMLVDDYLVTRLVEMLVHCDDLAVSVGLETPVFSARAWRRVVDALTETAVRRHGGLAVARALTRVERDAVRALRVF